MKKTPNQVKELKALLAKAENEKEYVQGRLREVMANVVLFQKEAEESKRQYEYTRGEERQTLHHTNKQLMEIVRWLASPETAKDPYAQSTRKEDTRFGPHSIFYP